MNFWPGPEIVALPYPGAFGEHEDMRPGNGHSILSAWAHADPHANAALYEPDGDFVSPTGDHAVGHEAIEAFYGAAFKAG